MKLSPKSLVVAVIFVVLIVGYYYYLSHRPGTTAENKSDLTEVQMITTENLDEQYPQTPREVIKLYNRIQTCYYNEEYTEEELVQMTEKARKLLDEELLLKNPEEEYLNAVKSDISDYKQDGKTISNITIDGSKDIRYEKRDGRDYAYVDCIYYIREGASFNTISQTYLLRKDAEGRWKILAFYLTPREGV